MRRAWRRRIPADTVRLLREMGIHPRTTLLRQLARANHWDLPEGFTPLGRFGEAALANLLGAVADVAQGDVTTARHRLGENAAVGFRLLEIPTSSASQLARRILGSFALLPLAELEQIDGNGRQAAELREAAQRLLLLTLLVPNGLGGLSADPANLKPVVDYLRNSKLPLGWRATLMTQVQWGACTNPREILLGASPTRRAAVLAAASRMAGVPHVDQLARRATQHGPTDVTAALQSSPSGPLGFLFRVVLCLTPG
jgi:hypothetical protein